MPVISNQKGPIPIRHLKSWALEIAASVILITDC